MTQLASQMHARLPGPRAGSLAHAPVRSAKQRACGRPTAPVQHKPAARPLQGAGRRFRRTAVAARAQQQPGDGYNSDDDDAPLHMRLPSSASTYVPFSAALLLATARLGHLERYRAEVRALYEPGAPVELTRCGLLISNLFQPQLDHRPYFEALEQLLAAATLRTVQYISDDMADAGTATPPGRPVADSAGSVDRTDAVSQRAGSVSDLSLPFHGLDLGNRAHVLAAVAAVCEVLFVQEGLRINADDPYDPRNNSLADVMDTGRGTPWSLAVLFLHLAEGLGLPCTLVGSTQTLFVRVGTPSPDTTGGSSSSSSRRHRSPPPVFFVSMSHPGAIFAYPDAPHAAAPRLQRAASLASSSGSSMSGGDLAAASEWSRALNEFLRRHRRGDAGAASVEPADGEGSTEEGSDSSLHLTCSEDDSEFDGELPVSRPLDCVTGDADSGATGALGGGAAGSSGAAGDSEEGISTWLEVDSYAAWDAATHNSWKALYGTGALAEWGGHVSSSSSSGSWQQSTEREPEGGAWGADSSGSSTAHDASSDSVAAAQSPFAAAAQEPFAREEREAELGAGCGVQLRRMDSLDTCCSSMELDVDSTRDGSSSASSSVDSPEALPGGGGTRVRQLVADDVAGGLQPLSKRLLLQQLLAGMKLALMMAGRQEELVLVLRYLRATDPFSLPDLRDLGLALAETHPEEAAPLLREYLAVAPGALDVEQVREVYTQALLRTQLGRQRGW